MKVLLVNGSPNKEGCTHRALQEVEKSLQKEGLETEIFWVGKTVKGCTACMTCKKTGQCIFDDEVNTFASLAEEAEGFIFGSPVYYGAPTGNIQAFMERLFCSASRHLTYKPAASVVCCRRGGATASFDRLNKFYTISNMPIIASQYWNMVHGLVREDMEADVEGLQTMRVLGQNMAWILNCLAAGEKVGHGRPQIEDKIFTNFVRR
ncbi:flavodoxin family protein [Peptococcus simiae]|uniref:flavodoxin family protein n=1 Tax=Peptococcus simiae TaxID=1643805 RepID=UPI0039809683